MSYRWIPAGEAASSACGDLGDSAAAYCPGDDTIYISEKFATDIAQGSLDRVLAWQLPGLRAHVRRLRRRLHRRPRYGHQVQAELGLFDRGLPTVNLELQADCFAGTWANHVAAENRVDEGDAREALDAALAVGDFDDVQPRPPRHARAARHGLEHRLRVR